MYHVCGSQMTSDTLELVLQVVVSYLIWVLGIKPGSPAKEKPELIFIKYPSTCQVSLSQVLAITVNKNQSCLEVNKIPKLHIYMPCVPVWARVSIYVFGD